MDSSPTNTTNASAIDNTSPEISTDQDSSIFDGLSDLCPLKSSNVASVAQGFTGLSSPPPLFSSPQTNTRPNSLDSKRIPFPLSSSLRDDDDDKGKNIPTEADESEKSISQLNCGLNPQTDYDSSIASVAQGFTGLNSAPPLFSSPQTNTRPNSLDLKRIPFSPLSSLHDNDDKGINIPTEADESEKCISRFNCGLNPQIEKVPRSNRSGRDQTHSLGENFDDIFVDFDCADSKYSTDSDLALPAEVIAPDVLADCSGSGNLKEPVNLAKKYDEQDFEQAKEGNQGSSSSRLKPAEKDGENQDSDSPVYHVFERQSSEQPVTEFVQGYNEYGQITGTVVPNLPILNTISHVPEATESQLGKRRPSFWNPSNNLRNASSSASSASLSSSFIIEELNQARPKYRRKKTSESSDGDGSNSCNCRKTNCLKLYCACFAAVIYCGNSCACQECSNRPDNETVVSLMRDEIKSTNPHAFSPKIISHLPQGSATDSREDGDRSASAPLSQRHIKGCTCKSSTCSKNYCVCYRAKVGCSDVCRCEGCENSYGVKGEYKISREVVSTGATIYTYVLPKFWQYPRGSTPFTPSFQYSDYGNDASDSGNAKGVGIFSSRFHKLGDNNLNLNPSVPTYSTSDPPRSFESPKIRDLVTNPRPQFGHGSASPMTPGRIYQQKNSDDILEKDETENPTPSNVAPPHSGSRSTSLSPLMRGQKVRLQAVSSSPPPFTPSMGSKNNSNEKKMESPENARNNE